jgi:hypothetical protein
MDVVAIFLVTSAQRRECHFSKIRAESTPIWAALGFWGIVLGARLENRSPHTKIGASTPPPNSQQNACTGRRMGWGGGVEW